MNKKILFCCIGAAAIIILATFTSAVGSNSDIVNNKKNSPLFNFRTTKKLNNDFSQEINVDYVGKNNFYSFLPSQRTIMNQWADKLVEIIDNKPDLLFNILDKLDKIPAVVNLLNANGLSLNEFRKNINRMKENPDILKNQLDESVLNLGHSSMPLSQPEPLGLSTSNPIGCVIIAIVLIPIFAFIAAIIATITIVTCLLPGCFENFARDFLEGIIQGLTQPDDYV